MRRLLILAVLACGACASDGAGGVSAGQDDRANPPTLDLPKEAKGK